MVKKKQITLLIMKDKSGKICMKLRKCNNTIVIKDNK